MYVSAAVTVEVEPKTIVDGFSEVVSIPKPIFTVAALVISSNVAVIVAMLVVVSYCALNVVVAIP